MFFFLTLFITGELDEDDDQSDKGSDNEDEVVTGVQVKMYGVHTK